MCQSFVWILCIPSFLSLIQSIVWAGLGIAGALVYQGVIIVSPYRVPEDFFTVTLVKLYFEGPRCILDGAYLGKFNEDYKNSNKFPRILTPDLIFTLMVLYAFLNIFHFIFSFQFYKNCKARTVEDREKLLRVIKEWSALSLTISALDVFLTADVLFDLSSLMDYMNRQTLNVDDRLKISGITYVPLGFVLLSSRFIVLWIWNVVIGGILFINAFCRSKVIGLPPLKEKKPEVMQEVQSSSPETKPFQLELELDQKRDNNSLEGVTNFRNTSLDHLFQSEKNPSSRDYHAKNPSSRDYPEEYPSFSDYPEKSSYSNEYPEKTSQFRTREKRYLQEDNDRRSYYEQKNAMWYPSHLSHSRKQEDWGAMNDAYVNEEQGPKDFEKSPDFEHNLRNFEQGNKKIKITKPPLGKPVSIPVPPPLPQTKFTIAAPPFMFNAINARPG